MLNEHDLHECSVNECNALQPPDEKIELKNSSKNKVTVSQEAVNSLRWKNIVREFPAHGRLDSCSHFNEKKTFLANNEAFVGYLKSLGAKL